MCVCRAYLASWVESLLGWGDERIGKKRKRKETDKVLLSVMDGFPFMVLDRCKEGL